MSYNFDKVQTEDYCCMDAFVNDILLNLDLGDEKYKSVTVVGEIDLIQILLREFSSMDLCGIPFDFVSVNIDSFDYSDLYYFSISNDMEIFIEKAWHEDNEYLEAGYNYDEADIIFIEEDSDYEILETLNSGENNIVIFGIDDVCDEE